MVKVGADGYLTSGYSTYLGGSGIDSGYGIAVDSAGHAYVTGSTYSSDFSSQRGGLPRGTEHEWHGCLHHRTLHGRIHVSLLRVAGGQKTFQGLISVGWRECHRGGRNGDGLRYGICMLCGFSNYRPGIPGIASVGMHSGARGDDYQSAFVAKLNSTGSSALLHLPRGRGGLVVGL